MPKVFLSYAHEDIDTARKICNDLTAQGVEVWLDANEILVGQNWRNEITKAIRESDYFMVLLSSNSLTKKGFVQKEMRMAWDILDEYPQDRIYFLPVRVDECQPRDERLRCLHYADLASDYDAGIQNLLRVLVPDENEKPNPMPEIANPPLEAEKLIATKPEPITRQKPSVSLRNRPTALSDDDVKAMLKKNKFFERDLNKSGDFKNDFKDNGNGAVSDRATGLMWQQSGSDKYMRYKEALAYVQKRKKERLAGYDDWRLPTLEELASLLESENRSNGLYIDPIFDKKQRYCWTSDTKEGSSELAWVVGFDDGDVFNYYLDDDGLYVRVVRAGQ